MKRSIIIIMVLSLLTPIVKVEASSGRLKSSSIITCNGVTYGQHSSDNHWHVASYKSGAYYATGSAIYNNPCSSTNNSSSSSNKSNKSIKTTTTTTKPKSKDNTLKEITIDNEELYLEDNMDYKTTKDNVNIQVKTSDELATYKINNNDKLKEGNNKIIIEVTAEDGSIKEYNLNIIKERILSSNTNIKVWINNEEITFKDNLATIYLSSSDNNVLLDYVLEDEKSTATIPDLNNIKKGNNYYEIIVTAEDGTEEKYKLTINKTSRSDETTTGVISIGILGGIGYGIYRLIKRKK